MRISSPWPSSPGGLVLACVLAQACVPAGSNPRDGFDGFVRPGGDAAPFVGTDAARPNGTDSGGGPPPPPPPPPPVTGAEAMAMWCAAVAEPICQVVFGCCGAAAQDEVGGTLEACIANVMLACPADFLPELPELFDQGYTGFDAAALPGCAADLSANAATCDRNLFLVLYIECVSQVWPGQILDGFPCPTGDAARLTTCAAGRCEDGVCSAFLPDGAPCNPADDLPCDLANGRICRPGPGGGFQCLPFLDEGGACNVDVECASLNCSAATGACGPVPNVCEEL